MRQRPVVVNALIYGGIVSLAIAVLGSVVGYLVTGTSGVVSALVGTLVAAIFMGLSAVSVLVAARVTRNDPTSGVYFAIVLGVWFFKLVVFLFVLLALRGQQWLSPYVFFGTAVAAVFGSLVADIVAMQTSRISYVGDVHLPGQSKPKRKPSNGSS